MDVRVGLWRWLSAFDAFELWCWRRLLRVPWTARRSNQSILKEISLGCSLEGLMNGKPLQYSCLENPMNSMKRQKDVILKDGLPRLVGARYADWMQEEKGTTEDEMAGWHQGLDGRESEWTPGDDDGQGGLGCCSHGVSKSRIWLSDWTEQLNWARMSQWF